MYVPLWFFATLRLFVTSTASLCLVIVSVGVCLFKRRLVVYTSILRGPGWFLSLANRSMLHVLLPYERTVIENTHGWCDFSFETYLIRSWAY